MGDSKNQSIDRSQPLIYQIRVEGHLGPMWKKKFAGLTITLEEGGETLLTGPVVDQAELHGLLKKIRDLGLPLVSAARLQQDHKNVQINPSIQNEQIKTGEKS